MLDIGWPELLVVVIVLIVIVGPKSAIEMARDFSGVLKKLKRTAGDFRSQFDDALKEADLGDVKDLVNEVKDLNPNTHLKSALDPLSKMGNEVKHDFNKILADAEPSAAAKSVAAKPKTTKKPASKATGAKAVDAKAGGSKAETVAKAAPKKAPTQKVSAKKPAAKSAAAKKPKAPSKASSGTTSKTVKSKTVKKPAAKSAETPKSDAS